MDQSGRLFQLGVHGWARGGGTNFPGIEETRDFIYHSVIPDVPEALDSYIALVDDVGMIELTFPIIPDNVEKI